MNHHYIPKQPIVQAFQLTKERWEDRSEWPWWLTQEAARAGHAGQRGASFLRAWIAWGCWIVRKCDGSWEVWNPEQFAQHYSPYLGQRGSFGARTEAHSTASQEPVKQEHDFRARLIRALHAAGAKIPGTPYTHDDLHKLAVASYDGRGISELSISELSALTIQVTTAQTDQEVCSDLFSILNASPDEIDSDEIGTGDTGDEREQPIDVDSAS